MKTFCVYSVEYRKDVSDALPIQLHPLHIMRVMFNFEMILTDSYSRLRHYFFHDSNNKDMNNIIPCIK